MVAINPNPTDDSTVDFVYSSHFLEHLYRADAQRILRESFRVLKLGGTIRISVPDLEWNSECEVMVHEDMISE